MASLNASVKYRPLRIAFLVREGSVSDVVQAAGINTLLWGGIYNPIVPVSSEPAFAEQLLSTFSVDVLYAVSHTEAIDDLVSRHPFLRPPEHHKSQIFFEDSKTNRTAIGYLDSLNIVDQYWQRDVRHMPEASNSNCVVVRWEGSDELRHVHAVTFGYFPENLNLVDDFEAGFLNGLKARELTIQPKGVITREVDDTVTPIQATGVELISYGGSHWGGGLYFGRPNSDHDLLSFWNLRAAGLEILFVPMTDLDRVVERVQPHLEFLRSSPDAPWRRRPAAFHSMEHEQARKTVKDVCGDEPPGLVECTESLWNGLNVVPTQVGFGHESALGNVERSFDRHEVSIALPPKSFLSDAREKRRHAERQSLAVSISPFGEFAYPHHTLRPPYERRLNEFFSREIAIDPWALRIERGGVAKLIDSTSNSVSIYPVAHRSLIKQLCGLAGITVEISQAGRITERVIDALGGVESTRVLKVRGVRRLLQELKTGESLTRSEATKRIWEGGAFARHESLHIQAREKPKLTVDAVFQFLLEKEMFRAGLELQCDLCRLKSWLSLRELDDAWTCDYCGNVNKTSLALAGRGDWKFRKSGLFAKDNNQEGAVPVALTLLAFKRILDSSTFIYSSALNCTFKGGSCETDFLVVQASSRTGEYSIAIGECKGAGGCIDADDLAKLGAVREKFDAAGIPCFLAFAKTAEDFRSDELECFREVRESGVDVILFTNQELEPYHPYYEGEDKLPAKYAQGLEDMARNSVARYLKKKE